MNTIWNTSDAFRRHNPFMLTSNPPPQMRCAGSVPFVLGPFYFLEAWPSPLSVLFYWGLALGAYSIRAFLSNHTNYTKVPRVLSNYTNYTKVP